MRIWVDFMFWLNNEGDCCFLPEVCLRQRKRFTAFVLAHLGRLRVFVCGSAGFRIRTGALFSFVFRFSRLCRNGWFRLKCSRYRNYRLYSPCVFSSLQRQV